MKIVNLIAFSLLATSAHLIPSTADLDYPRNPELDALSCKQPKAQANNQASHDMTVKYVTKNVAEAAVYVQGEGAFAKGLVQAHLKVITLSRLASLLVKHSNDLTVNQKEYLERIQAGGGLGLFLGFLGLFGGATYDRETMEMHLDSKHLVNTFGSQGLDLGKLEQVTTLEYEFWVQGSAFRDEVRCAVAISALKVKLGEQHYHIVSTSKDDARLLSGTGGVIEGIKEITTM